VFSALDAVVLRPLSLPDGDRVVRLAQAHPRLPEPFVAPVRLEEWNRLNRTFEAITGYYTNDVTEVSGDLPEKLTQALVAPRFLQVWRATPAIGRGFSAQEERFGGPAAAIISDALWRRRFDGRPDVVGRTLRVGRGGYTIVGVMPPGFFFPVRDTDFWSPSPMDAPYAQSRESTWFTAIGRLKPGVPLARARADLETVQAALGREYPKTDAAIRPRLEGLRDVTIGAAGSSLWLLFGSVSLLLVIACANVSALLLSRAAARRHEIALRFSLGASRTSVVAQILTEVLVLALIGAILGLLVAAASSGVFRALAADLPRIDEIDLNWGVVLYSLACALAATLLSGVLPAVRGTRRDPHSSLAQASRSLVAGRHGMPLVLVGLQVALAVTLLAGAALLVRSLSTLGRVDPGFDPEHVLTFRVSTTWGETADRPGARQRTGRILDAIASVPGVQAAAAAMRLPGVPTQYQLELTTSRGRAEPDRKILAESRWVTPGYFRTTGIPLVAGEACGEELDRTTAMVNRRFAETYLEGTAAIGQSLGLAANPTLPSAQVRGIVGDARETGLDRDAVPTVYWCTAALQPGISFMARTAGDPRTMAEAVRRRLADVEPGRSVYAMAPLANVVSDAYGENRLRTYLLAFFSLAALSLACLGLYGTLSYLVHIRQRETALRLALGAAPLQVLRRVVARGLRVAVPGCVVGLALTTALGRVLSGMLYGVSVYDPMTLAGVVSIVITVSLGASLVPALRASRLDPMGVLREE
jgi:predicted permease